MDEREGVIDRSYSPPHALTPGKIPRTEKHWPDTITQIYSSRSLLCLEWAFFTQDQGQ